MHRRPHAAKTTVATPARGWRLLGLTAALVGCDNVRYVEAFAFNEDVESVRIVADAGSVEVTRGDAVRVERAIRAPSRALELEHSLVDGELLLVARCTSLIPCAVDTRLDVPADVPIQVELGDGDVWVTGVDSLDLALGEGTADVDVNGRVVAQVGAGELRGRLGAGGVARVTVGSGDIDLQVPGGPWQLDVTAGTLEVRGVQPDDDAIGDLDLLAPAGTVRLTGGEPVAAR